MPYRLGVDVGGTFTDLILVDEKSGSIHTAKVPSTPSDSSIGVMNGVAKVCDNAGVDPSEISQVMHGTTVATNTVLTGTGAKVGLVTTKGYKQVLQIARSYVPGGLGGWVIYNKSEPLAPLACTIEAEERMGADGKVVRKLNKAALTKELKRLKNENIEALTVSLVNSYANPAHEREVEKIAKQVLPGIPVSLSYDVVPEMQEYERTITTVANSYVRPKVAAYVKNLERKLKAKMKDVKLHILRSDGGMASAKIAQSLPVNLLMSGPAGGVSGAVWVAKQAGFGNLLTFDMGGTSTDVALVQDSKAQLRRETTVGDVTVRASSVDVRTVGAGGGSIAHVPELTGALRVGPESAGAEPGPAAYNKGGELPTVTDANVVLGYLPSDVQLGGDMQINREASVTAVQRIADAMGIGLMEAAEGIIKIVNESMFGALRLVSVEQGYDPRDFALVGFGGAGPLHANALGILSGAWPVIVPPGPGVLCAYGDATTRVQDEAARTYITLAEDLTLEQLQTDLDGLRERASQALIADGIDASRHEISYQADLRYVGQAFQISVDFSAQELAERGIALLTEQFDAEHEQLFTFKLGDGHEILMIRAIVGAAATLKADISIAAGDGSIAKARLHDSKFYYEGNWHDAGIFDRGQLGAGDCVTGPAIVSEMDSTTVILPGYSGRVDSVGNLLIEPV